MADITFTLAMMNEEIERQAKETEALIAEMASALVDAASSTEEFEVNLAEVTRQFAAAKAEADGMFDSLEEGINRTKLAEEFKKKTEALRNSNKEANSLKAKLTEMSSAAGELTGKIKGVAVSLAAAAASAKLVYDWVIKTEKARLGVKGIDQERERINQKAIDDRQKAVDLAIKEAKAQEDINRLTDQKAKQDDLAKGTAQRLQEAKQIASLLQSAQAELESAMDKPIAEYDKVIRKIEKLEEKANAYDPTGEDDAITKAFTAAQKFREENAKAVKAQEDLIAARVEIEDKIAAKKKKTAEDNLAYERKIQEARAKAIATLNKKNKEAQDAEQKKIDKLLEKKKQNEADAAKDKKRFDERSADITERGQKRIDKLKEKSADIEERRQMELEKRQKRLGGFDKGLASIGDRIATAASMDRSDDPQQRRLVELNKDQAETQIDIKEATEAIPTAINKLADRMGMTGR